MPQYVSPFEGTEKKFEIVVDPRTRSLRSLGPERWSEIVSTAGAAILSSISTDACDAYLLSESSLFVFDHKAVMLTCGRTRLDLAVAALLRDVPAADVCLFVYERKNEVFPHSQPTSFFDDAAALNEMLPGKALQFGDEDDHHLYLFHLGRPFESDPSDTTLELLMYGIDDEVRRSCDRRVHPTTDAVRAATGFDRILPGFTVDDHLFEPTGYSLNAIRGSAYYAIHVTPEHGSYASFETNDRSEGVERTAQRVLRAFRPRSYDVILFDQTGEPVGDGYRLKSNVEQRLECGFDVRFLSYYRPQRQTRRAIELPVPHGA